MNKRLEIYSPLPPDECVRRISEALDLQRPSFFSVSTTDTVAGRVTTSSLMIGGELAISPAVRIFMILYLGASIFECGILFARGDGLESLSPLLLFGIVFAVFYLRLRSAWRDIPVITDFLVRTIHANDSSA